MPVSASHMIKMIDVVTRSFAALINKRKVRATVSKKMMIPAGRSMGIKFYLNI